MQQLHTLLTSCCNTSLAKFAAKCTTHTFSLTCCRNTEVLQEQLYSANTRADMAEQRAAEADGLSVQLAQLQSHQQIWHKVLQVPHLQLYTMWMVHSNMRTYTIKTVEWLHSKLCNAHAGTSRCTSS